MEQNFLFCIIYENMHFFFAIIIKTKHLSVVRFAEWPGARSMYTNSTTYSTIYVNADIIS